jgi:hypothetical protein
MAEQDGAHGFLDAAAIAFLARRLHNRHLRAAAVRGLKGISAETGADVQADVDHAADCLAGIPSGTAASATDLAAAPPPDEAEPVPRLSIVVMVVGSRGDVQPFIPIGRRLAERHRVRIATHREFRRVVEQSGLEFYPLAGDPRGLMEYMVKTGGRIIPTRLHQIVEDVPKKRAMIAEILASTWRACTEADPDRPNAPAFRADAILANPPSSSCGRYTASSRRQPCAAQPIRIISPPSTAIRAGRVSARHADRRTRGIGHARTIMSTGTRVRPAAWWPSWAS